MELLFSKTTQVTAYDALEFYLYKDTMAFSESDYDTVTVRFYWELKLVSSAYGQIISSVPKTWKVIISGKTKTGTTSIAIGNNETKLIASGWYDEINSQYYTIPSGYIYCSYSVQFDITFSGLWIGTVNSGNWKVAYNVFSEGLGEASIIGAGNFTDEQTPSVSFHPSYYYDETRPEYILFGSTLGCISLDGTKDDVPYREMSYPGEDYYREIDYTFFLTEAEKKTLRKATQGSNSRKIYFLVATPLPNGEKRVHALARTFTVVNANPKLNPTLKDINPATLALTGDENKFVKYFSTAAVTTGATPLKEATIVSNNVVCGAKSLLVASGNIENIESGTFVFSTTDSRKNTTTQTVEANIVDYVKLTCNLVSPAPSTDGATNLTITGKYFNGSFGAVDNTLTVEYRFKLVDGEYTDWLPAEITINEKDKSYTATAAVYDLYYENTYVFQARAIDKLMSVETPENKIKTMPVYDWGKQDFNFNVPVNINNQTVLRHNKEANNIVLSASGGHIYMRPKGTYDTDGETVISPNGDISFGGAATFDNEINLNGDVMLKGVNINNLLSTSSSDYIMEIGTETMGSNGTWKWVKWASGKAECWGKRNFGNMAVTTAWGNLYRSATLIQNFPENLFASTPDVISINMVESSFGGWICRHEDLAPSADNTGSFVYVRPASATATPTHIGFHIIGTWK